MENKDYRGGSGWGLGGQETASSSGCKHWGRVQLCGTLATGMKMLQKFEKNGGMPGGTEHLLQGQVRLPFV